MSRGSGTIIRSNAAAPPASVASAQNGLTLTGTAVELGGVNPLLHGTTIELDVFSLAVSDNFFDFLSLTPSTGIAAVGGLVTNANLSIDMVNGISMLGDTGLVNSGTRFTIDDTLQTARIEAGGSTYFVVDRVNNFYEFGDINLSNFGTFLHIDDVIQRFSVRSGIGPSDYLLIDIQAGTYQLGDISLSALGSTLSIVDASKSLVFGSTGTNFLSINGSGGIFEMGDINAAGTGSKITIVDASQSLEFATNSGRFLSIQPNLTRYIFGDVDFSNSGTNIDLDDLARTCIITARNGVFIDDPNHFLHTKAALTNGAGVAAGTLLNAPAAGNPTKWMPFDDNGITRYVPAW